MKVLLLVLALCDSLWFATYFRAGRSHIIPVSAPAAKILLTEYGPYVKDGDNSWLFPNGRLLVVTSCDFESLASLRPVVTVYRHLDSLATVKRPRR